MLWFLVKPCFAQVPFSCEGQVWVTNEDGALLEVGISTSNGLVADEINPNLGLPLFALGFSSADRYLYGMYPFSNTLYRVDALGAMTAMVDLDIDPNLAYIAGTVSPDGSSFFVIGSDNGMDSKMYVVDLLSGNFDLTEFEFTFGTRTVDFSFHPLDGRLVGYDTETRSFYSYVIGSNAIDLQDPISIEHDIRGLYFDAFGNMFGLGTALFGTISGVFSVDQLNGATRLLGTSGLLGIVDVAGCPYSLEIDMSVDPQTTLPCSDIRLHYALVNRSNSLMQNISFEHALPDGYSFYEPEEIPFGGTVDPTTASNVLRIEGMNIPKALDSFSVTVYVDDIPKDIYYSQVYLGNVPDEYGGFVWSNDPFSPATEDSTRMEVNRFDEDSLAFSSFLCHGSTLTLDASDYGNNLIWSTGATSQKIDVTETGIYDLVAQSGCSEIMVSYEVVTASCPYTIEIRHLIEPDTILGCSDVLFRYILENDSGEERYQLSLVDTLPLGFSFVEVVNNPYQSTLSENMPPNIFQLEDLLLHEGIDTIDILVNSGEGPTGAHKNNATIKDLPQLLGPKRISDDPSTLLFPDSTYFFIRGVEGGVQDVDTFLCEGTALVLDASDFGEHYFWEDGTSSAEFEAPGLGSYEVLILDGCDTGKVNFNVYEVDQIDVYFGKDEVDIHQGQAIILDPSITNAGDSLSVLWNDGMSGSLSCLDCLEPVGYPTSDIIYSVIVENEYCTDTAWISVYVDETRRIFAPNIFSPGSNDANASFYLQSPDPGLLLQFTVFDRWGNQVFEAKNLPLNDPYLGWTGETMNSPATAGVYVWYAEIQFFDGKVETLMGDVTLVR